MPEHGRKDDGGPAFPQPGDDWNPKQTGLSVRDWFAGQALAGMLADRDMNAGPETTARIAYNYADAMLAEARK